MNIILYVDFKSVKINNDFKLANALTREHTVLLVTNEIQLNASCGSYDIIVVGQSAEGFKCTLNKRILYLQESWDLQESIKQIEKEY